jgi:hypothetical protein
LLVLGVGIGKSGVFDSLGGIVDTQLLPPRDGEQVPVELCGSLAGVSGFRD